jgi:hypothetical protein
MLMTVKAILEIALLVFTALTSVMKLVRRPKKRQIPRMRRLRSR